MLSQTMLWLTHRAKPSVTAVVFNARWRFSALVGTG